MQLQRWTEVVQMQLLLQTGCRCRGGADMGFGGTNNVNKVLSCEGNNCAGAEEVMYGVNVKVQRWGGAQLVVGVGGAE